MVKPKVLSASFRLTEEQRDFLEQIAEDDDLPISWLIRRAIDEYIERCPIKLTKRDRKENR